MIGSTVIIYTPPRPTLANRLRDWFGRPPSPDDELPDVLRGDVDAEPVLGELEDDPPAMRPCILRARKYADLRMFLSK